MEPMEFYRLKTEPLVVTDLVLNDNGFYELTWFSYVVLPSCYSVDVEYVAVLSNT